MDFRVFSFFVWEIERKEKKKTLVVRGWEKNGSIGNTWFFYLQAFVLFLVELKWVKGGKSVGLFRAESRTSARSVFIFPALNKHGGGACRTRKRQQTATHAVFSEKKKKGKIKSKIFAFRKEENTKMLTRRADFERQWTSNICMP